MRCETLSKMPVLFLMIISCGVPPKERALTILREGIKDKSEIVQVNAAKALIEVGDKEGYEVIYKILKSESKDARVAALVALYSLKENQFSPLILKLTGDSDPLVKAEAYHLITLSNDTAYYQVLLQGINDRIARIRRYSYQGLGNFRDIKNIVGGLRDPDPLVRIIAAKTLGLLGNKEAKNFIKNEMDYKNPNIEIWSQALLALGELKDTSAIPYIKELFTDTPYELRIAAAEALLLLNDKTGVEVLISALQSPDPFVRTRAVETIEKFPLPDFYEPLKEACRDEYINVSISAINALVKYQKKENLKLFAEMLSTSNPLVRIAAASAYLRSL